MRYLIKPLTYGWLLLACLVFSINEASAQANITPDEFTAKSGASPWAEGSPAPNPKFNDLFNKKYKLYDLLDKPTIIEIIPKDCNGCDRNLKYLKSFYKQFSINIITVRESEYRDRMIKSVRDNDIQWSVVLDDGPKYGQSTLSDQAQVSFILVTPDKKIYKVYNSPKEIGKLGVDLQQYFKKG